MNDHQCVLKAALVVQVGPPPPSVANLLTFERRICLHFCDISMQPWIASRSILRGGSEDGSSIRLKFVMLDIYSG